MQTFGTEQRGNQGNSNQGGQGNEMISWPLSCLAMDKASELEGEGEIPYKINCVMSYFLVAFKERNQSN